MILDAALLSANIYDFCVVGSGPVGMALVLELERLGHDVLLLESGGLECDPHGSTDSAAILRDPLRHAPMEIAVCRALGGTSWTWGGRCVPYDDVDLIDRAFVPDAQWPISHEEIRPWYSAAVPYMSCGSDQFSIPFRQPLRDGLRLDPLERWASNSRLILLHRERLLASRLIHIALNCTLTGIQFQTDSGPSLSIANLEIATPQGKRPLRARHVILAMGGVETTRLLLHIQQSHPEQPALFGGPDGPLGRYYMGHISGKIASIHFDDPAAIADLDFKLDSADGAARSWIRRRFMLDTQTQLSHQLLNTAFWPDNPPFYDPSHRSGVLSAVFLALVFPPTGRRLLSEAIRLAHTGPRPYPLLAHLSNVVLGAPRAIGDIYRILRDRFLRKPRKPGFLVPNRSGEYALHYHAEQIPHPDSRITLSHNQKDRFGISQAVIDLRFDQQDVDSVIRSHQLLDQALRSNKIGHLRYWYTESQLSDAIWKQAADGFHQIGSIRMGHDPATSVVDGDLRAHGVENLYIASSAVFPSSGQANSTLLAVALGLRLVHHLHANPAPVTDA